MIATEIRYINSRIKLRKIQIDLTDTMSKSTDLLFIGFYKDSRLFIGIDDGVPLRMLNDYNTTVASIVIEGSYDEVDIHKLFSNLIQYTFRCMRIKLLSLHEEGFYSLKDYILSSILFTMYKYIEQSTDNTVLYEYSGTDNAFIVELNEKVTTLQLRSNCHQFINQVNKNTNTSITPNKYIFMINDNKFCRHHIYYILWCMWVDLSLIPEGNFEEVERFRNFYIQMMYPIADLLTRDKDHIIDTIMYVNEYSIQNKK